MSESQLESGPPDLIAFKWAETLSDGEQSVLLASSLRRLQNMINSRISANADLISRAEAIKCAESNIRMVGGSTGDARGTSKAIIEALRALPALRE